MTSWKSIFTSKTLWGVFVSILATALQDLGYTMTEADVAEMVELIMQLIAIGGALYAGYGRIVATKKVGLVRPDGNDESV